MKSLSCLLGVVILLAPAASLAAGEVACGAATGLGSPVRTFVVNRTDDVLATSCTAQSPTDCCTEAPDGCSLRGAIIAANASPGLDAIKLNGLTYLLRITGTGEDGGLKGDLDVTDAVIICGASSGGTVLNAGRSDMPDNLWCAKNGSDAYHQSPYLGDRVLDILPPTGTVEIDHVTIQGGYGQGQEGGGIRNQATSLVLRDSAVKHNFEGNGAGIHSPGVGAAVTLERSTVACNSTTPSLSVWTGGSTGTGGGLYVVGQLQVIGSIIRENTAGGPAGAGGGIALPGLYPYPAVSLTDSLIEGNRATYAGGGIYTYGRYGHPLTISSSRITGNQANESQNPTASTRGVGGGIFLGNGSSALLSDTWIVNNTATVVNPHYPNCADGSSSGYFEDGGGNVEAPGTECGFPSSGRGTYFWVDSDRVWGNANVVPPPVGTLKDDDAIAGMLLYGLRRTYGAYQNRPATIPGDIAAWNHKLDAKGISSFLELAEPSWLLDDHRNELLTEITNNLLNFNKDRPVDQRFRGLNLDVEPHQLAEWKTSPANRVDLLNKLAQLYEDVRSHLDKEGLGYLPVTAAIPRWFDTMETTAEDGGIWMLSYPTEQEAKAARDAWFARISRALSGITIMAFCDGTEPVVQSNIRYEAQHFGGELRAALNAYDLVGGNGECATWGTIIDMLAVATNLETDDPAIPDDPKQSVDIENFARFMEAVGYTPAGTGTVVDPVVPGGSIQAELAFQNVTKTGDTTITPLQNAPPPPSSLRVVGAYYDIQTAALFTGLVTVCFTDSGIKCSSTDQSGCANRLYHYENDTWIDVTLAGYPSNNKICGEVASLSPFAVFEFVDTDMDGLGDDEELALGTNPLDPDTDDDGLLDGTEVDMAEGGGCPDPLALDSDGDHLTDGTEVNRGTNPCAMDTDADRIPDDIDPYPLDPQGTGGFVEEALRTLAADIGALDLGLIVAPNANAAKGRRNAMSNQVTEAANDTKAHAYAEAESGLTGLLEKLDGEPSPPDWIAESPQKKDIRTRIQVAVVLLGFLM